MKSGERLHRSLIERIRDSIADAEGNEVLFVGRFGESGLVEEITEAARGGEDAAPALYPHMERGDVVIHNHPSGILSPSPADMQVASKLGNEGIGFYLIDNEVSRIYCVGEPVRRKSEKALSAEDLAELLLPGGRLSRIFPDYEARNVQIEMLETIVRAFNERLHAVIEAGTGVGKSLAYLLPSALWALENEERVIVSTATINLQQQLIEKDIPLVERLIGKKLEATLVKGRGNYLCLRRLKDAAEEQSLFQKENRELEAIESWAENTEDGSRSDLSFLPSAELWSMICSEADACMGLRCPHREECFVIRARRRAAASKLLVVNHHLLFSDMAARLEGAGFEAAAVLPPAKRIIFDEAHTVERNATSFFSTRYNKLALYKQLRRLSTRRGDKRGDKMSGLAHTLRRFSDRAELFKDIPGHVTALRDEAELLDQMLLSHLSGRQTLWVHEPLPEAAEEMLFSPVRKLRSRLSRLLTELEAGISSVKEEFEEESELFEARAVMDRLGRFSSVLGAFEAPGSEEEMVHWIELGRAAKGERFCSLIRTPLEVAPMMRESVFEPNLSVVSTSATLTVRKSFSFWLNNIGLGQEGDERVLSSRLESPFAYRERVLLAVPTDAPEPKEEDAYQRFVTDFVAKIVELSEGSALVLFTSYRMLQETYQEVAPFLEKQDISVFKQGDDDRSRLLASFHSDVSSVLFATDSFWEGVDAPGESLRVVIICRLPFSVPTDPVNRARMEMIEARGGNSFMDYSLPHAAMRLKQGFGRLMRRQSDRGVVCILDSRIVKKSYGRVLLETLPETLTKLEESTSLLQSVEDFLYQSGS